MNPWTLELLVVRTRVVEADRRTLARDAERGMLVRVRPGVYAAREGWQGLAVEERHIVMMRALAAVSQRPPVFTHWSAAVLHGLPVDRRRLDRVHVTVAEASRRGLTQVVGHLGELGAGEVVQIGLLRVAGAARTTVDVALASPFREGVMAADGALHAGLARAELDEAIGRADRRRGAGRARRVIAFARAEAESPAESQSRVTMFELKVRPPVLQFEVFDRLGLAGRLDFWFPLRRVGGEVDGEKKYLDRSIAPLGAARAVIDEKRREDRVRRQIEQLARWGWRESLDAALLGPILTSAGVRAEDATFDDYCAPMSRV